MRFSHEFCPTEYLIQYLVVKSTLKSMNQKLHIPTDAFGTLPVSPLPQLLAKLLPEERKEFLPFITWMFSSVPIISKPEDLTPINPIHWRIMVKLFNYL